MIAPVCRGFPQTLVRVMVDSLQGDPVTAFLKEKGGPIPGGYRYIRARSIELGSFDPRDGYRCSRCQHFLRQHGREAGHCGRCRCNFFAWGDVPYDPVPALVMDPFAGSGTTLVVARRLGRCSIGLELNPKYVAIAERRIKDDELSSTFGLPPKEVEKNRAILERQQSLFRET